MSPAEIYLGSDSLVTVKPLPIGNTELKGPVLYSAGLFPYWQ